MIEQESGLWKCSQCGETAPGASPPMLVCKLDPDNKPEDLALAPEPSKGLGDTVAKITTALGIKPCRPCKKRQEWLNKLVPYGNTQTSA